jgi:hypothetical protein
MENPAMSAIPSASSAGSGHNVNNASRSLATSGVSSKSVADNVRFGQTERERNEETPFAPKCDYKNGFKQAFKAAFNKDSLLEDLIWVTLSSVVLFIIPGHQFLILLAAPFRAIGGFFHGLKQQEVRYGTPCLNKLREWFGKNKAE